MDITNAENDARAPAIPACLTCCDCSRGAILILRRIVSEFRVKLHENGNGSSRDGMPNDDGLAARVLRAACLRIAATEPRGRVRRGAGASRYVAWGESQRRDGTQLVRPCALYRSRKKGGMWRGEAR